MNGCCTNSQKDNTILVTPNAWKIAVNKAKIDTVIIAGNNAANERETAGGTPSGMLMTKRGLPARRRKISVEMIDTINAKNNP